MVRIRSFHQYLSSMVILFTFILRLQCEGCVGDMQKPKEGEICCANHRKVDEYCQVCEVGYYGKSCSKKCHYPFFGVSCLGNCNCTPSKCDHKFGCRKNESTPAAIITTASSVHTSVLDSFTSTSSQKPETTTMKLAKTKHQENNQENNTNDNKFVVPLSVTVSSSALIVLVVVLSKLRGNNKGNVIYYVQNPENNTPQPVRNQVRVPFRNLETDIYMDIEELDEMDEISNTSCRTIPNDEN